ncbi:MAG: type II secretion system protein [Methylophilaceae bacterium]
MKQTLMMKEKGFTLLELLVVVSIIAILSAGALLAYEGLTDKAQAATASNNTATADQAIRNYRAVTQAYPNQWDNLLSAGGTDEDGNALANTDGDGVAPDFMNNESRVYLAAFGLGASALNDEIAEAFEDVGVEEVQTRLTLISTPDVEPNLQHNEGAVALEDLDATVDVAELLLDGLSNVAIVPTGDGACQLGGAAGPATYLSTLDEDGAVVAGTAIGIEAGQRMNAINDSIESDECHLVVAFGFGHDAAHSTANSSVAVASPPTFISQRTNPNENYARYIALFHVGADANDDDDVAADEVFEKPRLLAVLDTEGNVIDQNVANANDASQN